MADLSDLEKCQGAQGIKVPPRAERPLFNQRVSVYYIYYVLLCWGGVEQEPCKAVYKN